MADNIKVPTWLKNNVKDLTIVRETCTEMTICSSTGNDLLEVWYFGDFYDFGQYQLIVNSYEGPCLIIAKDPETKEEILIFDNAKHGYDNLFCVNHDNGKIETRPLKKLDIPPSKLVVLVGYDIEYESEKEFYKFNSDGKLDLINGGTMTWEELLIDGIDWFNMCYVNVDGEKVEISDAELA
ncbi:MAG: hypothetical protein LBR25_05040 [Erysipelotrichaceae bacterium]|jgi:hypothetical protein|nr:hypothetical protein [Erysipelotrichaceae bacterium]